jgi:hypothetical protein
MWDITIEQTFDVIFVMAFLLVIMTGIIGNYRFESIKKTFEKSQQWIQDEMARWSYPDPEGFAKEAQQYMEIWEKLIQVRNKGLELVSISGAIVTDEYHRIQKEIYFDKFFNSWIEFRDVMDKNKHYLDPVIYEKLDLLIGDKLIKDRGRSIEFTPKFIEEAEGITKKIILGIDEFCDTLKREMTQGVEYPKLSRN